MPVIINWDGSVSSAQDPKKERTSLGGLFTDSKNIQTYFPIAPIYSNLLPTISVYKVPPQYAEKPALIAMDIYGSSDYWWVIYWSNGIIDPFGRPAANEMLRVIDIQQLQKLLVR